MNSDQLRKFPLWKQHGCLLKEHDLIQVDPDNNPDYVMGPGDDVPRLMTPEDTYQAAQWYTAPKPAESVCAEADRLVSTDRGGQYGAPRDDFAKVTGMALALWGRGPETPEEHAMYMILVKLSREAHMHKRDNLVDIAGYAKTLEMLHESG